MAEQRAPWLVGLAGMAAVVLARGGAAPSAPPPASALAAPFAEAGRALSLTTEDATPTNTWVPFRRLYEEFLGKRPLAARRQELRGAWGEQRINLRAYPLEPAVTPTDLTNIRAWAEKESYELDFMVALVPDPIDSRLPSSFDLTLAGLQMSLSQADFILDRKWLPWTDSEFSRDSGEERVAHQTAGLMLFRRVQKAKDKPDVQSHCLLGLFLVGETPVRGIHREAFTQAVNFISGMQQAPRSPSAAHACRPAPASTYKPRDFDEIRVMGPSFSGSPGSLCAAILSLNATRARQRLTEISFRIVTGTATAKGLEADFYNDQDRVTFSRTVVPDDVLTDKAFQFMHDSLGWDLHYAALLTEGDTAYGQQRFPINTQLVFPSGLSAIRNAWEESGAAKGADRAAREPVSGRQKPALDISLADPATQADSVRELSPLTSRIDEMAMTNLLRTISRYGIRYVGIVATDVKDEIFLAEQIRRSSPDVILFLFESNLIYLHPQVHPALFGSLAITSFPLTNDGLTIERESPASVLMFGSEVQEGVYRATQCLLEKPMEPPEVWFVATGNDTMSPVAEIPVNASFMLPCPTAKAERARIIPFPEINDVQLLLLMLALALMAYWLGNRTYLHGGSEKCPTQPQVKDSDGHDIAGDARAGDNRARDNRARDARAMLILGEVLLSVMGAGLLALALLPVCAGDSFHEWKEQWASLHPYLLIATGLTYGGLLLCLAQALAPNAASPRRTGPWPPRMSTALVVAGGGCLAYFAVDCCIRHYWSVGQPGFFYLRARRFANGLSPFVSLGWLGAAFFAWINVEMKRQQLSQRHGVAWPLPDDEPALSGCAKKAGKIVKFLAPIWPRELGLGGVVLVAIVVGALFLQTAQPVADPRWYGCVFVALVYFAFVLSLVSFYRFLKTWRLLRDVLSRLEHCKCRQSFAAIAGTVQWNAMKSFVWYTPSFRSIVETVRGLKELGERGYYPAVEEASKAEARLKEAFAAASDDQFAKEVEARKSVTEIVDAAGRSVPGSLTPEVQELRALRVVGYLRHVFGQMRYALIGAMVPGLLLIVAVNNYTFIPSRYMSVLFWTALLTASAVSLLVFVQMDRDVALSEIGNTSPGKVTFDRAFLSNIFAYAILPLLALISSQVPEIGQLFGHWLDPLTRILEVG